MSLTKTGYRATNYYQCFCGSKDLISLPILKCQNMQPFFHFSDITLLRYEACPRNRALIKEFGGNKKQYVRSHSSCMLKKIQMA